MLAQLRRQQESIITWTNHNHNSMHSPPHRHSSWHHNPSPYRPFLLLLAFLSALLLTLTPTRGDLLHLHQPPSDPQLAGPQQYHTCPSLTPPRHGSIVYTNATFVTPLLATFQCALGRELIGEETSICHRSGEWSHTVPTCRAFGVRAYPSRTGTSSVGVISIHDPAIITGLSEASQRTPTAAGFLLRVQGDHTAHLLREHPALGQLIPSQKHEVWLYTKQGVLKRYPGMKVAEEAFLKEVEFAKESSVLKALRSVTAAKRANDTKIIGFTVAQGKVFRAALLAWNSLPLRTSVDHHAFILRKEVEDEIKERGCYYGRKRKGTSLLAGSFFPSITLMSKTTTIKTARLVCAAIARKKSHQYFAISQRNCTSGNTEEFEQGAGRVRDEEWFSLIEDDPTTAAVDGKQIITCARSSVSAAMLKRNANSTSSTNKLIVGAGAAAGYWHVFAISPSLLPPPLLRDGSFESKQLGHSDETMRLSNKKDGKNRIKLDAWSYDLLGGDKKYNEVGIAGRDSPLMSQQTPVDGNQTLYIKNTVEVSQTLSNLVVGQKYKLSWHESYSLQRDYAPGLTLSVKIGSHVKYQNPYVSIPMWSSRNMKFIAKSESVKLSFVTSTMSVLRPQIHSNQRPDSVVLIDHIKLSVYHGFDRIAEGKIGRTLGYIGDVITSSHPNIIESYQQVAKQQAKLGNGGVGFRLEGNNPVYLSKNDMDGFFESAGTTGRWEDDDSALPGETVYLNNGTFLRGSTLTFSGYMPLRHPFIIDQVAALARKRSNSIGFSLAGEEEGKKKATDNEDEPHDDEDSLPVGLLAYVLSSVSLPLLPSPSSITYFFDNGVSDLGCWAMPSDGGDVLSEVRNNFARSTDVSVDSCALAAQRVGHSYFGLRLNTQGEAQCISGSSSRSDPSDELYYAQGRSRGCDTHCANGRDNCGGRNATHVFRLPLYKRVSKHGQVSVEQQVQTRRGKWKSKALRLSSEMLVAAQSVFDVPGSEKSYFSTIREKDQRKYHPNNWYEDETRKVVEQQEAMIAAAQKNGIGSRVQSRTTAILMELNDDGKSNTSSPITSTGWSHSLLYHFPSSSSYAVSKYILQAPILTSNHPATPSAWKLEGSNTGKKWYVIDEQHNEIFYTGEKRVYYIKNERKYQLYRLTVTENSGAGDGIAGFGIQGLTLYARQEKVRFLQALYRFEPRKSSAGGSGNAISTGKTINDIGYDSSFRMNDLDVFGGDLLGNTNANTNNGNNSIFTILTTPARVKIGHGSLQISNTPATPPKYLALNDALSLPKGIPSGEDSFSIAFWFFVDSGSDAKRFEPKKNEDGSDVEQKQPRAPSQYTIISWGDDESDTSSTSISITSDYRTIIHSFGLADSGLRVILPVDKNNKPTTVLDKWHHYSISYDSSSGLHRVWYDTVLVASRFYQLPEFHITPERFLIGVKQYEKVGDSFALSTSGSNKQTSKSLASIMRDSVTDEFNGLLDDIAIFSGTLTDSSVKSISTGDFTSYLPLSCQGLSDTYSIEAGVTWGRAPESIQRQYLRQNCYTKPVSCQILSDQTGMTPFSFGQQADYDSLQTYQRMKCATFPSVIIRTDTYIEGCPDDHLQTYHGIPSYKVALKKCNRLGERCRAFVYADDSLTNSDKTIGMKPFEMRVCDTYMKGESGKQVKHITSTTRVEKYLLYSDSMMRCDSHSLPTHTLIPSSLHARLLCDSTPGCVGYIWSGVRSDDENIPGRTMLCGSMRRGVLKKVPESGFEVGMKLQAYTILSDRDAECSEVSRSQTIANVTSSLQARYACDQMDGLVHASRPGDDSNELSGASARCVSYRWDRYNSVAELCSSVPQTSVTYADGIELGLLTPFTCQALSDAYSISYGKSWGHAPFEMRELYHTKQCTTRPRSCQKLSDRYQLSPDVTADVAAKVPGVARDLWLKQRCRTSPTVVESQYFLKETYIDLQVQLDVLQSKIAGVETRLRLLKDDQQSLLPASERDLLLSELLSARTSLQNLLDTHHDKQILELTPLKQAAAESKGAKKETNFIHDIVAGILKTSVGMGG